ncbi:phage major capsid protein [Ottowia sp. GY511]|uniref:Phage major capsid protein n=1 Tax=Ottowia flava TaxID=2675430 RepID=A0ABW4KNI7_9BURK|nr:phage major capsid protein [Ottowia sp. GY511]TXK26375.1 phage major capsid protein [Ottowia sp. GY511]
MKTSRLFAVAAMAALAVVSLTAQAMGFDVAGFAAAHSDVLAGLSMLGLAGTTANVETEYKQVQADLKKVGDDLKGYAEQAQKDLKAHAQLSADAKAKVDELLLKQGELQANQQHIEQALAKLEGSGAGGDVQHLSLGQQFVQSDDVKAFLGKTTPRGRVDLSVNAAITSLTTNTDGAAGDLVQTTRVPGIVALPQRRLTVRDLISPGQMDGSALEYVKETGFTNAAAPVAEGAKKPESTMKFDLVSTTAKVIAHYVKASRQILSDASQLASLIDQRLRYGLAFAEEKQLLNGDGTGQNLLGIIPQATAYAAPFTPAGTVTEIDKIRLALLQSELAEYPSSGIVMHPSDWARIELLKDTTGRYIIGNPQGTIGATLWNIPVVTTQAIDADKVLTGAFKLGAQLFDRWLTRVEVATENEDDFVKNMVTILAEERLALAVYRPEAFVYADLGNVGP